ncbi:MAG: GntR family transcriptional regulator [Ilumatobacteraceae bacterium]|nr:GntR family transcriptional regulator [Ilumatobacteraceae bacterium]
MRHVRYQEIADELRTRVRSAAPGSLLPSEAELSREFSASRVTIRRALEVVREDGLIAARQGFGWFVSTEPVRQSLERLGTIESQLETSGRDPARRVIDFSFESPPVHVRKLLGPAKVLRVKRVSLADGEPFAVVTVWCPAVMGQRLSLDDVERRPFSELLDVELRGATQTIGADSADADLAGLLAVPVGAPLLKCQRVTADLDGNPVLVSEHYFPAHRTEFVVDLPHDEPSITPAGLRLVE